MVMWTIKHARAITSTKVRHALNIKMLMLVFSSVHGKEKEENEVEVKEREMFFIPPFTTPVFFLSVNLLRDYCCVSLLPSNGLLVVQ